MFLRYLSFQKGIDLNQTAIDNFLSKVGLWLTTTIGITISILNKEVVKSVIPDFATFLPWL